MMQEKDNEGRPAQSDAAEGQRMATNPNPRANENIKESEIDKNTATDKVPDVGSEITDGEAS